MSDDDRAQDGVWPLPKFHFRLDLGDGKIAGFAEVSGLEAEGKTIEYRHGDSSAYSPIKMPGLRSVGTVTLKKGVISKDPVFRDWFASVRSSAIERRTVMIELLNDAGAPMMRWTLTNAWPTKLTGTDPAAGADTVTVETLELAYEALAVNAV